jgi:Phage integrase family
MTVIRVKGFQIFKDRHGTWRCYHRKTRARIDLRKAPLGSAEFFAECDRITARIARKAETPGTLGMLIALYRDSYDFRDLAPRTKQTYQRHFDYLKPIADTPLARFDKALVVKIRDKARRRGWKFANDVRVRLSGLFACGALRKHIESNVAADIPDIRRPRSLPDANRLWTDAERHAVLDAVPAHMKPGIALMMYTGMAPVDVLELPRGVYRDGEIVTKRSKTGTDVFWPVPAPLAEILANAPEHQAATLCANSHGRPWTIDGFRTSWSKVRIKLEKEGRIGKGLTLYGLRHTVAVILREMGHNDRAIADALGQETTDMVRRYTKGADMRRAMRGVAEGFADELDKRRTGIVKPDD